MTELEARYGTRAPQRWVWVVVAVIGIAAAVTWAAWAAFQPQPPSGSLWGYKVLDTHHVQVSVDIRRPDRRAAECTVYAQADDHAVVGERTIRLAAGHVRTARVHAVIKTERRAVNGVLRGCRAIG